MAFVVGVSAFRPARTPRHACAVSRSRPASSSRPPLHITSSSSSSSSDAPPASSKRVLVPIANGSEEIESVTIVDTLVRAGAEVTMASVEDSLQVTASRGVKLVADAPIADCEGREWDAVVLPGGMPGAERLRDSEALTRILERQNEKYHRIAAICAAPAVVLAPHGLLEERQATCYPAPAFLEKIPNAIDDEDVPVVVDGNVTTSRGPGTALVFALNLVDQMYGKAKADELAAMMLLDLNESWTYQPASAGSPH